MATYYECPLCRETPTVEEWNEYNKAIYVVFGIEALPDGKEDGQYDCPHCEENICGSDLLEI